MIQAARHGQSLRNYRLHNKLCIHTMQKLQFNSYVDVSLFVVVLTNNKINPMVREGKEYWPGIRSADDKRSN